MCLCYVKDETDQLRDEIRSGRTTFYKRYVVWDNGKKKYAAPPCYGGPLELGADGLVCSDRKSLALSKSETGDGQVFSGIHVHLSLERAEESRGISEFVIPVTVKLEDFVAAGCGEAVFMAVTIDPAALVKKLEETEVGCWMLNSATTPAVRSRPSTRRQNSTPMRRRK